MVVTGACHWYRIIQELNVSCHLKDLNTTFVIAAEAVSSLSYYQVANFSLLVGLRGLYFREDDGGFEIRLNAIYSS